MNDREYNEGLEIVRNVIDAVAEETLAFLIENADKDPEWIRGGCAALSLMGLFRLGGLAGRSAAEVNELVDGCVGLALKRVTLDEREKLRQWRAANDEIRDLKDRLAKF